MKLFRYQAIEAGGAPVKGEIEAADRKSALQLLGERGLFPSLLESRAGAGEAVALPALTPPPHAGKMRPAGRVSGKDVTAFTREMGALLGAAIPIPQALDGLGEEEENPALRAIVLKIADSVRKGAALSAALEEHPKLFSKLYVSMVRVGEEAGVLPKVMADLAELLEHEDELRGEVRAAVAYPVFVLGFGCVTVTVLLTVVMPKLFSMLTEMATSLPLPTIILLRVSGFIQAWWIPLVLAAVGAVAGLRWYLRSPRGAAKWDGFKLKLPVLGGVYRAAALSRFARTLGTLAKSGVSLLPALKIVEHTIEADRASRRGDARRRFAGHAVAQAGHFSPDGGANDQRGGGIGHVAGDAFESGRHRGTPHAGAHQDADFAAGAGADPGGGGDGRLHGHCAVAAHLQDEPGARKVIL